MGFPQGLDHQYNGRNGLSNHQYNGEVITIEQSELLQFALESGMINLSSIQAEAEDMERRKILQCHTNNIWQGTNGRWYTYLDDKLIKRVTKQKLEDFLVEHYRYLLESPPFEKVFQEWAEKKLEYGEIQKQTYDNYLTEYRCLISGTPFSEMRVRDITENILEDFIKLTIKEHQLTVKRWGNLRIILSGTIKYAKKQGFSNISMRVFLDELELSSKIFHHKPIVDSEQVFTKEEISKIKEYVWAREPSIVELGVLLGIETGMRRGEIAALMRQDIDEDVLHVRRTEVKYKDENGKTAYAIRNSTKGRDGSRDVILTDEAKKILRKARNLNPFGQYVFGKNGTWVKGHSFTKRIQDICKMVRIKSRAMHKLRKTYATNLLNAHVDDKIVEKQMGHTEILTTKKYYYFDNRQFEESKKIIQTALG